MASDPGVRGGSASILRPAGTEPGPRAPRPGLWHWCRESLAEPVLSVLFPPRCVGCGDFEVYLCDSCRASLVPISGESCPRCGEPGQRAQVGGRCSACMAKDLTYRSSRSAFRHETVARRLVAEFKFGGQPVLGRLMAEMAEPAFTEYASSVAPDGGVIVTWVPSHKAARRERGYNQAEILARLLAGSLPSAICTELVVKGRGTRHQKGLDRAERASNLRGAFSPGSDIDARLARLRSALGGRGYSAVVLVDDVYTTGATAAAVSSVLAAATALPVHVFTFSRAVAGGREGHD